MLDYKPSKNNIILPQNHHATPVVNNEGKFNWAEKLSPLTQSFIPSRLPPKKAKVQYRGVTMLLHATQRVNPPPLK